MIFHYTLNGPERYLDYFTISLYHLTRNAACGDIFVSTQKEFFDKYHSRIKKLQEKIPFHLSVLDWPLLNKHACINHNLLIKDLNKHYSICQIDVDCVYMGDNHGINAYKKVTENISASNLGIYIWYHERTEKHNHYESRKSLLQPVFREFPDHYNNFSLSLFSVGDEDVSDMAKIMPWIYGGLFFYPKRFIERKAELMNKLALFGSISPCDETPLFALEMSGELRMFNLRNRSDLGRSHIVCPSILSFDKGKYGCYDFVHFAGDHYREHNVDNKNIIYKELNRIKELLKL